MQLSNVSMEDGKYCATLVNILTKGRWDLSGSDAEELMKVRRWVHDLAMQMAQQLKSSSPPPAAGSPAPIQGMKIKSAGPLPGKPKSVGKRKK